MATPEATQVLTRADGEFHGRAVEAMEERDGQVRVRLGLEEP